MSTVSRGSAAENRVANQLKEKGWLPASRRHMGGAGDLLFIHPTWRPLLIEVKSGGRSTYEDFGPDKREAMRKTAEEFNADPWFARVRGKVVTLLHASEWPPDNKE